MSPSSVDALLGLRLSTERLELRLGTEEEIAELARLADRGIHPPDEMPFRIAQKIRTKSNQARGNNA